MGWFNRYTVGKTPLFYTADSDELRPTLYLLHCAPQLMEQVRAFSHCRDHVCIYSGWPWPQIPIVGMTECIPDMASMGRVCRW
jgi:hypothetical protein